MPRKAQKQGFGGNSSQYWFASIRVNVQERKGFDQWCEEHSESLGEMLTGMATSGYKLSVSYDDNNDCFIASYTCQDAQSDNAYGVMTSRSDDFLEAVMLGLFKHYVIAASGAWERQQSGNNWG